jgi:hypothetical protein
MIHKNKDRSNSKSMRSTTINIGYVTTRLWIWYVKCYLIWSAGTIANQVTNPRSRGSSPTNTFRTRDQTPSAPTNNLALTTFVSTAQGSPSITSKRVSTPSFKDKSQKWKNWTYFTEKNSVFYEYDNLDEKPNYGLKSFLVSSAPIASMGIWQWVINTLFIATNKTPHNWDFSSHG